MKWTGIGAMLLGSVVAIQAASTSTTQKAETLLREINTDSMAVRSVAAGLDRLAENGGAKWIDYDRQWNEIAPSVEDMQMKLARLEAMQSSLTPAERTELDQRRPLIGEIRSMMQQFVTLLNMPGVQTSDARFKTYARSLRNDADKLRTIAPAT
jgi:hypothetical protein